MNKLIYDKTREITPYSDEWEIYWDKRKWPKYSVEFRPKESRSPILSFYISDDSLSQPSINITPYHECFPIVQQIFIKHGIYLDLATHTRGHTRGYLAKSCINTTELTSIINVIKLIVPFNKNTDNIFNNLIEIINNAHSDLSFMLPYQTLNRLSLQPISMPIPLEQYNIREKLRPYKTIQRFDNTFPCKIPRLHYLIILETNNEKILEYINTNPDSIYRKCPYGLEPIEIAFNLGKESIVKHIAMLILNDNRIDYNNKRRIKYYLEQDLSCFVTSTHKEHILHKYSSKFPKRQKIFKMAFENKTVEVLEELRSNNQLLDKIKNNNYFDPWGYSILQIAVHTNNIVLVKELFKLGIKIANTNIRWEDIKQENFAIVDGYYNLFAEARNIEMKRLLLQHFNKISNREVSFFVCESIYDIISTNLGMVSTEQIETLDIIYNYIGSVNMLVKSQGPGEYCTIFKKIITPWQATIYNCKNHVNNTTPNQINLKLLEITLSHMRNFIPGGPTTYANYHPMLKRMLANHDKAFARVLAPSVPKLIGHHYLQNRNLALCAEFEEPKLNGKSVKYESRLVSSADLTGHEKKQLGNLTKVPNLRHLYPELYQIWWLLQIHFKDGSKTLIEILKDKFPEDRKDGTFVEIVKNKSNGLIVSAFSLKILTQFASMSFKDFVNFYVKLAVVHEKYLGKGFPLLTFRYMFALAINLPNKKVNSYFRQMQPGASFNMLPKELILFPEDKEHPGLSYNIMLIFLRIIVEELEKNNMNDDGLTTSTYLSNHKPNFNRARTRQYYRLLRPESEFSALASCMMASKINYRVMLRIFNKHNIGHSEITHIARLLKTFLKAQEQECSNKIRARL